jgi:alpha-tubulin suppressor-like RCC1 family protein
MALLNDGSLRPWGSNFYGEGTVPSDLGPITQIAVGAYHNVALRPDQTVRAWGAGMPGSSGDNNCGQSTIPAALAPVTQIAAGYIHTILLMSDGSVRCLGDNSVGQSGTPADVANVTHVACGTAHTLVISGPPVVISGVIPVSGPATGGTPITITGSNFSPKQTITVAVPGYL